jgi:hypothetical protein
MLRPAFIRGPLAGTGPFAAVGAPEPATFDRVRKQ